MHAEPRVRIVPEPTGQARQLAVGRVPLVHERARHRAGTGVEIFVGAPDGEIDVPIVQRQRHVADRVREIDPDHAAALLRRRRDFLDVEQLTGEKVHAGDKHQRDLVALLLQQSLDVLLSNGELPFARTRQNERLLRIEPVMNDLRLDRIGVGRERPALPSGS